MTRIAQLPSSAWVLVLLCASPCLSRAQITIDWKTQKLTDFPKIVSSPITTVITVVNVNDILYSYEINLIATPRAVDDAAALLTQPTAPPERTLEACGGAVQDLNDAVNDLA